MSDEQATDEAQAEPITYVRYDFYAKLPQGTCVELGTAVTPTNTPITAMAEAVHQQLLQKKGLGAPRPTHYTAIELQELPEPEEGSQTKATPLILPADHRGNGAQK